MHGQEGRAVGYSRDMKKRRTTTMVIGNGRECREETWQIEKKIRQLNINDVDML